MSLSEKIGQINYATMFTNGCIYVIMRLIYYCYLQLPNNSRNSFMCLKPFSKCGLFTALDVVYWMVIEKENRYP